MDWLPSAETWLPGAMFGLMIVAIMTLREILDQLRQIKRNLARAILKRFPEYDD